MSALSVSLIAFACIFGATLLSLYLRKILPAGHLSTDTRDTVRLSMGVIGTMAALVLSLLIASAKSSYDDKSNQIKQLTVNIIVLDQLLNQYGPETYALRNLLRTGVASLADKIWSERDSATATSTAFAMSAEADAFLRRVEDLKPQTELQRTLQARAIATVTNLAETRLLLYAQGSNSIPLPFLVLLVFWLAIRPAIADVDPDIVTGRHLPAELATERVVIFDARQHRHGATLFSGPHQVQPGGGIERAQLVQSGASALRSTWSEIGIKPENGLTSSKMRKSAPDAESAHTKNDVMTIGLG